MSAVLFVSCCAFLVLLGAAVLVLAVSTAIYMHKYPLRDSPGEYADDKW